MESGAQAPKPLYSRHTSRPTLQDQSCRINEQHFSEEALSIGEARGLGSCPLPHQKARVRSQFTTRRPGLNPNSDSSFKGLENSAGLSHSGETEIARVWVWVISPGRGNVLMGCQAVCSPEDSSGQRRRRKHPWMEDSDAVVNGHRAPDKRRMLPYHAGSLMLTNSYPLLYLHRSAQV